jgi:hypothetical protein
VLWTGRIGSIRTRRRGDVAQPENVDKNSLPMIHLRENKTADAHLR